VKGTQQLRREERRPTITQPVTPPPLPDALLAEAVSIKLLWVYLRDKGVVSYSSYKLAEALGLSQRVTTFGLARLRDRELGLVEDLGERRARVRAVYQAVDRGERPVRIPATHPRGVAVPRDPPHLPVVLKGETPTTRLVYLYLEPYGEVEVSVRQLEGLLGVAHRNAAEALRRLVELGLLKVLEPATSRPGRYRVKQDGESKK